MTKDEALKLALEALEDLGMKHFESTGEVLHKETFTAIKEALAQPEQEPVAWVSSEELLVMRGNALGGAKDWRINVGLVKQDGDVGLYTIPPQRTWVGLTDEEIWGTISRVGTSSSDVNPYAKLADARAIEAKLKEKNT